jgi:F0F1-type ATP synthase membrane subunit b/b'
MSVEFNLSNLIFALFALIGGFWALVKIIVSQYERSLDGRFKKLSETIENAQKTTIQLERDFLTFQAEIPRLYLRRDDYMREAKILRESISSEIAPIRTSVNP